MSKITKLFSLLFFLVQSPLFAMGPSLIIPQNFFTDGCNPCQITPQGQDPFSFSYRPRPNDQWQVRLNQNQFNLNIDQQLMEGEVPPFYQYQFFEDHQMQLYGLRSSRGVFNEYFHYFKREKDQFHYLGNLPRLSYDKKSKLFSSLEKDGSSRRTSYYQLKENKFGEVPASASPPVPTFADGQEDAGKDTNPKKQTLPTLSVPRYRPPKVERPKISVELEIPGHSELLVLPRPERPELPESGQLTADNLPATALNLLKESKQAVDILLTPSSECSEEEKKAAQKIGEEEYFKQIVICALNKIYSPPPPHMKRMRTLNFIARRLVEGFSIYNIKSDIEKAHFLAQIIHESDGFSSMFEVGVRSNWTDLARDNESSEWNCDNYLKAVEGDKDFFNQHYEKSRENYKAAFRGRGLIQLTGCANYLEFFYHQAALKAGKVNLSQRMKRSFSYRGSDGTIQEIGMHCTQEDIKKMANQFVKEGLILDPKELTQDFERTVNQLSLPCRDSSGKYKTLDRQKFIVDSSFWFWKRCQSTHGDYLADSSAMAVAKMSQCIHGSKEYESYDANSCKGEVVDDPGEYRSSYCRRLNVFNELKNCFGEK